MRLVKKIYFKVKRKIINFLIKRLTFLYRPSSEPYISGDTFRKISDHVYDESKTFLPNKVKTNDIIFLQTDLFEEFFKKINSNINAKYILISHNSDNEASNRELSMIDDKILFWFAQNLNVQNGSNYSLIPIGLENLRYQTNGVLKDFDIELPEVKKSKIAASFNVSTNIEVRSKLKKTIERNINVESVDEDNHRDYILNLRNFMFNLCPVGNGFDTHRIWESLLVKTIPIVVDSEFTRNLASLNFPILVLDSWENLNKLNSDDLKSIYIKESEKKQFDEVMKLKYWKKIINSKKIKLS